MANLAEALSELYQTPGDIQRVVGDAGLSPGQFQLNDSALNIWSRVVERARVRDKLWELVQVGRKEYPEYAPLRQAWEQELTDRRSIIFERADGEDTALKLIMDLIWDTRSEQKEIRRQVSDLRHDTKQRLEGLERLSVAFQKLHDGHAADIRSLQDRPESMATWIMLLFALAVGALGGLVSGWGCMLWLWLDRVISGG